MRPRSNGLLLLTVALLACNPDTDAPEADVEHALEKTHTIEVYEADKVDIVLVVDDSASMADHAAAIAEAMVEIGWFLTDDTVFTDFRLAVIPSSVTHPLCQSDPALSWGDGAFIDTSCRAREGLFTSTLDEDAGDAGPDVYDDGCLAFCSEPTAALLDAGLKPTSLYDDAPAPRPWLEVGGPASNLPAGLDSAGALACLGPVGVAGCRFEQPLEALRLALGHMADQTRPEYGFLRPDASLFIAFLTDEDDCSHADPLLFDEQSPLWGDDGPNSATCWHAAAGCEEDEEGTLQCHPHDVARNGEVLSADQLGEAALHPLHRYAGMLEQIEAQKKAVDPDLEVTLGLAGGHRWNGGHPFAPPLDARDETFGRAAGCTVGGIRGYPSVRLASLVEQFAEHEDDKNPESICGQPEDVFGPLSPWWPQLRPGCFRSCALDTDPSTPQLEPQCVVEETLDGITTALPRCEPAHTPPDGSTACYDVLTDPTPGTFSSMSSECVDEGWNLEFRVSRTTPRPQVSGHLTATCSVSPTPSIDCPSLD